MKKKILRILGIFVLVVLGVLVALPFFLEGKIADIIKNKVNQNINATHRLGRLLWKRLNSLRIR